MAQTAPLSGIQPAGTIIYSADADEAQGFFAYEEQVIASNQRLGKQVVSCKSGNPESLPLWRVEWYPSGNGAWTHKPFTVRADAMAFYQALNL